MVHNHTMRPVHAKKYSKAHSATDYQEWYCEGLSSCCPPALPSSFPVCCSHARYKAKPERVRQLFDMDPEAYEPYVVGPRSMPRYDERFIGYGLDKVGPGAVEL